jgi:hypothetical protein
MVFYYFCHIVTADYTKTWCGQDWVNVIHGKLGVIIEVNVAVKQNAGSKLIMYHDLSWCVILIILYVVH